MTMTRQHTFALARPGRPLFAVALVVALGAAQADEGSPPSPPSTSPPPSLTLDQALERLDAQNLSLAQAKGRAEETRGIVRQAMAAFLPTVSVGGQYVRNSTSAKLSMGAILDSIEGGINTISPRPVQLDRSQVPGETVIQPLEAFSGQASVRVPLFAANAYHDFLAALESAKAVEASVASARLQLRGALLQAAWWSGAAEETADASERALSISQEHERSAARAVQAGTSAPLAHLQAQTDVVRRESDLVRARAERQRAWLALGVLLGEPKPARIVLPSEPTSFATATTERLTHDALERRPELRSLEASVRAAQRQVDSAWWRLLPQLSASASAFASNIAYVTGEKTGWRATVELTWALYDGGFRYGRRAQAEGQLAAAWAGLGAQKLEVSQQVLDATRDLEVAKERLRLAARQKELAVEVAASAKRSFSAGLASSLDVLDANDRLYQSEVGQAEARARLGMASAALARVTGALLEGASPR